jgi:hypothetical protein
MPQSAEAKASPVLRAMAILIVLLSPFSIWNAIENVRAVHEVGAWNVVHLVSASIVAAMFLYVAVTGYMPHRRQRSP